MTPEMPLDQFAVEVSLNGQQFSNQTQDGGSRQFVVYKPPRLERTFPDTGPIGIEGALQLNGTNFIRGSDYVCDYWVEEPVQPLFALTLPAPPPALTQPSPATTSHHQPSALTSPHQPLPAPA